MADVSCCKLIGEVCLAKLVIRLGRCSNKFSFHNLSEKKEDRRGDVGFSLNLSSLTLFVYFRKLLPYVLSQVNTKIETINISRSPLLFIRGSSFARLAGCTSLIGTERF